MLPIHRRKMTQLLCSHQSGNLDPSHPGIRLASQLFDPFRNLGVQRGNAHFVFVDAYIRQGIVLEQLSDPRQLLCSKVFRSVKYVVASSGTATGGVPVVRSSCQSFVSRR
jgi:hypothetical protein